MKPVIHQHGRSREACIASILELRLKDVPTPTGSKAKARQDVHEWLGRFGLTSLKIAVGGWIPDGYAIGTVKREDAIHHVVCLNGKIVFDPHPEQDSYGATLGVLEYFVLLNPATHWALGIESLYPRKK